MDELICSLEQLTYNMIQELEASDYSELSAFVEQRQFLVDAITELSHTNALSHQDIERLREVVKADDLIEKKMIFLKQEASDWLNQRQNSKVQRGAYENSFYGESILMDYKK
ncbi:flagellar protein FliT [Paenibacillus sp. GYB006]|uniref:flagellar protein FliT n=1 Tax=Paenibacillus sp. GYB006 TaxID=2994394 RepID=UPI002F96AD68